jgi:nucleotide-binding universal stress UspA family protein
MLWNESRAIDFDVLANGDVGAAGAQRLVVATDLSPSSDLAVRRAFLLADRYRSSVHLLHVVSDRKPRRVVRDEMSRARWLLEDWYGPLGRRHDLELDIRVEVGATAETIGRLARADGADLIVFGEHRKRLFPDLLTGGTMVRAMRASGLPALAVQLPPRRAYQRVLLGLDMTERMLQIISRAMALGMLTGPAVSVVHAFTSIGKASMIRAGIHPADLEDHVADMASQTDVELREFLSRSSLSHLRPTVHVEDAHPYQAIQRAAEMTDADLVIVGERASSGLGQLLRGSMASELLNGMRCDILAVPTSLRCRVFDSRDDGHDIGAEARML